MWRFVAASNVFRKQTAARENRDGTAASKRVVLPTVVLRIDGSGAMGY
jgi:hypothetical protein